MSASMPQRRLTTGCLAVVVVVALGWWSRWEEPWVLLVRSSVQGVRSAGPIQVAGGRRGCVSMSAYLRRC